jgi:hypothetical protein
MSESFTLDGCPMLPVNGETMKSDMTKFKGFIPMKKLSSNFLLKAIAITATSFGFALTVPAADTNSVAPAAGTMMTNTVAAEIKSAATNKLTLKVVKVDSEETAGEDGKGTNAVDGNSATFWHTQWQDATPSHPHEIIIELSAPAAIKGFTYLPRQDDMENGTIKDYEFYVSDDGKDFGQPVKKGTFENNKEKKTATFDPKKCRFIKLKALSEVNDGVWTSAAEIGVVTE